MEALSHAFQGPCRGRECADDVEWSEGDVEARAARVCYAATSAASVLIWASGSAVPLFSLSGEDVGKVDGMIAQNLFASSVIG